ncbi:hypothetical protein Ahy_B01g056049 [Arachis hypogaea]|uniref:Uncharacterized protein n=1 Tax=Arachis hypogaea TaxID=3818 RepID=A0A445AXT1_ARAHY|nr:hypothetical protein Ahy_B01g056049 [Arachis hypogaea]
MLSFYAKKKPHPQRFTNVSSPTLKHTNTTQSRALFFSVTLFSGASAVAFTRAYLGGERKLQRIAFIICIRQRVVKTGFSDKEGEKMFSWSVLCWNACLCFEVLARMGDDLLTILFHHGGSFITDDGGVTYNGGDVSELPGVDTDKLDDLGYDKVTQTWWLVLNRPLQNGLRALTNDKELMEMCYLGQQNKRVVHVYYEHGVSEPLYIEEAEAVSSKGKEVLVIQDLNPTPNPTTNDNAEPIPTTAASTTTSAPIHSTIPTEKPDSTTTLPPISITVGKPAKKYTTTPLQLICQTPIHPPKIVTQPSKTKPKNPPKKMSLPTEIPKPCSKSKETKKSAVPRRGTRNVKSAAPKPCGRRPLTRAAASGASPQTEHVALSSSEDSSDSEASDGCEEDEPYGPDGDLMSSEEDVGVERLAGKKKTNVKERTRKAKKTFKQKRDVMVEDDGPVCADSGSKDDAHFFGPIPRFGSMGTYDDAQDEGYEESDGGDSWHSEELKTPPNSEDELEEVDLDEVFPVFRDGGRFGELRLAVGMIFTTKMEFKEAVREYCIQEGRRIWFKKNDNVRMRAVCKDENCGWLVYAANNTENNYWQIKTFNDDHTCARETKNRLANRKWLAGKLVKKLRKYPNLRHCEAAQYFKTKCDLELSKNCEKRAADEVAAAAAAAGAAAVQPPAANGGEASVVPESPTEIQLEASQPPLSQIDDSQEVLPPPVRPPKLPPKRKSSKQEKATPGSSSQAATTQTAPTPPATTQPTTLPPSHPMQGASQGTVTRLFNFMKFVPNPGFRPPENKK